MPRILVADDNTNIQKMVTLAFQERGVEVIAVGNGEAAVRRMPDANPDLVLADVFMPVRNGYEVCEFVKKDTRFAHVPVILLVGAFDPLDEKEARRVGADGVLKKPFVPPDPLIAMVMSALEKNPRVAAELAKAKEVVAVIETPLPAAALENPAMAEPKPLPEFPEPSPEEAAVIYGFGKGVRAMDLDEQEEEEDEPRAKKKTKEAPAPKAPAQNEKAPKVASGPKTQSVVPDDDEEESDESDNAATANDWRRNAADFEVPENVAADPVYSYGRNFEPITFPSERDVPPKRVRVEDKTEDDAVADAGNVAAKEIAPAVVAPAAYAPVVEEAKAEEIKVAKAPAVVEARVEAPASFAAHDEPTVTEPSSKIEAAKAESAPAPAAETFFAEPETKEKAAPEVKPAAAQHEVAPESTPRPSFVSRVRGWMDMMSPAHEEEAGDHWMNKIAEPPAEQHAAAPHAEAVAPAAEPEVTAEVAQHVEYAPEVHAETLPEAAVASGSEVAQIEAEEVVATSYTSAEVETEDEPRKFGESKFGESGLGGSSYHFSEDAHSEIHEAVMDNGGNERGEDEPAADFVSTTETAFTPAAAVVASSADENARNEEPVVEAARFKEPLPAEPEPVTSAAADFAPEVMAAVPVDAGRNGDSASEHKPSEPWLTREERDERHEPEDYFAAPVAAEPLPSLREEEIHAESAPPAQPFVPTPSDDYWNHEAAVNDQPVVAGDASSLFTDSAPPPALKQYFERVPTLPPPNREALSDIPFLMPPPPSVSADSSEPGTRSANSDTVDEVVRKVLEKLQPQLHELLTQGVKPLVENLIQNELHKKEK
ncbi:MAG: response regulator [Candidatus Acidiferrales bacterium]